MSPQKCQELSYATRISLDRPQMQIDDNLVNLGMGIHKVRRRKGGTYPLSHLYGYFGLVRLCRLGHDVPWVKA
jgi:hypothetical protein